MSFRLIENVYECDESGQPTANLKQCLPVLAEWKVTSDRVLLLVNGQWTDITEQTNVFVRGDGDVFYAVGLTGDNPKFTLTEDPMHDNCAPCQAGLPEEAAAFMRMC